LTSVVALFAIAGGQIYPFLDPIGGCLVSLLIIKVGLESGRAACQEIVDRGLDPELLGCVRTAAEEAATAGVSGVKVGDVRGTKSGTYYIVDVEVEMPSLGTIEEFDEIKSMVVKGVREKVENVKIVRVFVTSAPEGEQTKSGDQDMKEGDDIGAETGKEDKKSSS
jgi:divalent metal cation (Fe/Co/Zn/Cd) transporter